MRLLGFFWVWIPVYFFTYFVTTYDSCIEMDIHG
jgi:hypothetical protein